MTNGISFTYSIRILTSLETWGEIPILSQNTLEQSVATELLLYITTQLLQEKKEPLKSITYSLNNKWGECHRSKRH